MNYIQEKKIHVKNAELIRTNLSLPGTEPPTPDINPSDINPSAPTTVIDGTTIVDDYDYQAPYASFEPTQAPGSPSESVVKSTTPPSIPASDPDSRELEENGLKASGLTNDVPGSTPVPDVSSGKEPDPDSVPSGNDNAPNAEDLGISSTRASTIANADPSAVPEVPKKADIVMSPTEVPSPKPESEVGRSQEVSDSPVQPEVERRPTGEEPPEGSGGNLLDNAESMWEGLTSIFSLSSGSGEVEDETTDTSADSNPLDELSLKRGPSPKMEGDSSETGKPAEGTLGNVEVKTSDVGDQATKDGKAKRSVLDSVGMLDNGKTANSMNISERFAEPAKSEKEPVDSTNSEQVPTDPTLLGHDSEKASPEKLVSGDSLTNASSETIDGADAVLNVVEDLGKTLESVISAKAPELDSAKIDDKSPTANTTGGDLQTADEPTTDGTVSNSDNSQEHTQETRMSMSSSRKTDVPVQEEKVDSSVTDAPEPKSPYESEEVTVETDDTSVESKNDSSINDHVPESPIPIETPSESREAISTPLSDPPKVDQFVESESAVLETDEINVVEDEAQAGSEKISTDNLQSVTTPIVEVQQVTASEPVAPVEIPADVLQKEKQFGLSDLNFVSPMEFIDPRKTNPDLYSSDLPSTEAPMAEAQNQGTASVEEVPVYNQWVSTPVPPLTVADPVPNQPSSTEQHDASEATPKPNRASEVGPVPADQHPTPPSFEEPEQSEEFSEPWYSGIFSVFGGVQDSLSGSPPDSDQPIHQADSLVTPQTAQGDLLFILRLTSSASYRQNLLTYPFATNCQKQLVFRLAFSLP